MDDKVLAVEPGDFRERIDTGVGFLYSNEGQYHVCLYYPSLDREGAADMCHLAWDCDLRVQPLSLKYFRFPFQGLEPSELKVIAGMVGMLASRNASVKDPVSGTVVHKSVRMRYGFVAPDHGIFDEQGDFVPFPLGEGLTCATFIHRVLLYGGYATINLNSLDCRAEDEQWQKKIVELLSDSDPDHARAVLASLPARRLRPELMAAIAGCADDWEVMYSDELERLGTSVIEQARLGSLLPPISS